MFLLHAELGPGKREETFQDLVQSLGGVSVQHEELIKALLPGAGAVLEAGFYLQSRQELRRLVLADCSKSTISARLQMMGHVAKAVKYSFPVLVGELLVQEVGHRPKLRTVGLGLQRFEDLLPAEPLAVLVPQNVISPGTERLGLSLVDNNLPGTWDSFVGREKELRDCQLLTGRSQLITIKGCGGVGKTRFVQHLAALMRHQGIEVIRYVRFSDLPPGSPVLHRFLDTCQLSGSSLESFIDRYREKRTLVVLDNCEHVLPEARGLVKGLLHDFPLLTLICTTREPFEVPGEVVYELGGLETPSEEVQLSESGAIQLFVDRYREQRPLEILPCEDLAIIEKIVTVLDGLPLAIEHAAFRASVVGLQSTLESLGTALPKLKSERQHYEPRQRTISATLQWSFDLLTEEERRDFLLLTLFRTPFDERDFAAIEEGGETWNRLMDLHRKSMIRRDRVVRGHQYFRLLEVVVEYGRSLVDESWLSEPKRRWAVRAGSLALELHRHSEGEEGVCSFEEGQIRYPSLVEGLLTTLEENPEQGAQMVQNLLRYWTACGPAEDALRFIRAVLARDRSRLALVVAEGTFLWLNGDPWQASEVLAAAAKECEAQGDEILGAVARANLASLRMALGDFHGATNSYEKAVSVFTRTGESGRLAGAVVNLAQAQLKENNPQQALTTVESFADPVSKTHPHVVPHLHIVRADGYRALNDAEGERKALIDGLSLCQGLVSSDAAPGLLLRAALWLSKMGSETSWRIYGAAQEAYQFHQAPALSKAEIEGLYELEQSQSLEKERARGEAEGALLSSNEAVSDAMICLALYNI